METSASASCEIPFGKKSVMMSRTLLYRDSVTNTCTRYSFLVVMVT
jgi:hypothetical protein